MAKVELTQDQQAARRAYKAMQRALQILVAELYGMTDPDGIMAPLTNSMDALEKKYGKEATR